MTSAVNRTEGSCAVGAESLRFKRVLFLICPTGAYCREDRCQSFFDPKLIPTMRPPMEECEAAGAVTELGGAITVIDAPAARLSQEETLRRAALFSPDLIILSVTFGSLEGDLSWVRILREKFPAVTIGLRGAPCYALGHELMKNPEIDLCLRGDYELTLQEILTKKLDDAAGILTRNEVGEVLENRPAFAENLDSLPLPDRSGINQALYQVRGIRAPQATVRVQRGCPFPCTYCLVHSVSGNRARHRSAESIVRELKALLAQGIRYFYFRAETFSLDREWVITLSRKIAAECPAARWVTTTRAECVDLELLQEMRRGGCYGISFGLDVGSKTIGKLVKKPVNPKVAASAMRWCDDAGILSLGYIMIGFLWDTRETLQEVRSFIREVRPDLLTVHFAHPYPGTPYFEAVRAHGIETSGGEIRSAVAQAAPAFNLKTLTTDDLVRFGKRLLVCHYLRPQVLWQSSRKIARLILDELRTTGR